MSFRLVKHDDVVAFATVWVRADAALHRQPVPATPSDEVVEELRQLLHHDARTWALLAHDESVPVGAVRVTDARSDQGAGAPIEGLAHLASLAVEPTRWGTSIGTALVLRAEAAAAARGYDRIQLVVHDTNTRAKALYTRLGWGQASDRLEVDGARLVRFEKRLA